MTRLEWTPGRTVKAAIHLRGRYNATLMNEKDISTTLLVRSVEEFEPEFFGPETQFEALKACGEPADNQDLVLKRAEFLFQKLPEKLRGLAATMNINRTWAYATGISAFLLGILFNYLGPIDKIHVLFNPVVLLLLWNVAVFIVLIAGRFLMRTRQDKRADMGAENIPSNPAQLRETPTQKVHSLQPEHPFSLPQWFLKKLCFSIHQQFVKKKQDMKDAASSAKTVSRYMEHWWDMNQKIVISRFARTVHILALCLVAGALTGIYIRGLFFEYNVVWKSTFIHDPSDISLILNALFGLPSLLLRGTLINPSDVTLLLHPGGDPAAPWIHLFAVSTILFVFPLRLFLAALETGKMKGLARKRMIDLSEPYYRRLIALAAEMHASRLQGEVSQVVEAEFSRMSESIASYTRDRFFDENVAPLFIQFREKGGRIRTLEDEITLQSEEFKDELDSYIEKAQEEFRHSLAESVSGVIGKKLAAVEVNIGKDFHFRPNAYKDVFDVSVTQNMTDFISVTVTAAVAAAAGTVSGGFGKVLGIAVVSALLHTSGPVGFLIGALAGLLLGGGTAVLARDKITDLVKNRNLPGFSTQLLMSESKLNRTIEQARTDVHALIKREVEEKLAPHTENITGAILSKISLSSKGEV